MQLIKYIIISFIISINIPLMGQIGNDDITKKKVSLQISNGTVQEVITILERAYQLEFLYNPQDIKDKVIAVDENNISVPSLLDKLFEPVELKYKIADDQVIIYSLKDWQAAQKKNQVIRHTISGYVRDLETTETLIGVNILDKKTGSGTTTNEYGFFSMTLPEGDVSIVFSYIGYEAIQKDLTNDGDISLSVDLSYESKLEEIVITAVDGMEDIQYQTQMSQFILPVEQLKSVPVILGEQDLMKSMQLLPGVKSGVEGTSGIYVRGGSQDQNLILLDGVPVYNAAHALGIFSVFNPDAIKSVTLTKGGFPARYGGRLSSVLDIRMKEGNLQEWHGDLSLGLISSKLSLSGPLVKDKTSILISGRRTYADLILKNVIEQEENRTTTPSLYFYDFNAKIQHKINDKHRLYLSGYFGQDKFGATFTSPSQKEKSLVDWGNQISALRWNYEISNKFFANTTLTYSKYAVNTINEFQELNVENPDFIGTRLTSGIQDIGMKIDFDYIPMPNHYLKFGLNVINHNYTPGVSQSRNNEELESNEDDIISTEYAVYLEDDMTLGKLKANIGVHASALSVQDNFYTSVQPRIGLRYLVDESLSLKASFNTMSQYINLLATEAISLPSDLWVPSTARIKPQQSWQAALGVAKQFKDYELSIEGYYKEMNNVLSYREGATFLTDNLQNWEDKVTQGEGEAYGAEVFFQKKKGKLTGWIGYTLSWTNRQFEDINQGEKFPFRYDRRHDASIVISYDIKENIKLSANWIYGTGNAVTLPQYQYPSFNSVQTGFANSARYQSDGGDKNAFRMSASHRLDWSISFIKKKKKYTRTWVLGVYNSYYRKNPFYLSLDTEIVRDNTGNIISEKSIITEKTLLPIIPSVSYQISF